MSLQDEYVASIAKKEEKRNYKVELLPSVKQRLKLDTLFAGPELVLSLINRKKT
ncbi:MAG: hypothetical protein Q7T88_11895 [Methylotenera sp.]|nr:hypothetical protein [Methylotenera sp.]